MSSDRQQRITTIFHSAIERESRERAAYLDGACGDDQTLRREVEELIKAHQSAGSFIASPAYERAADLLGNREGVLIGRVLGQYRLVSLLGEGGMGEVYLADDTRLDRKVAIKVLPPGLTADQSQVGRFQQEARAASALNHPNIITVFDINESDGTKYIATEYIEGITLRRRLLHGPLSVLEALDIAIQIASALGAAHVAGVVHRDIKPENVMLRPDGYVKVLDFGIAKLSERLNQPADGEALTRALVKTGKGMVMGTVHYMSPEQARGNQVDARTDIWALGVVLYEMVTGLVPFAGDTASDCIATILKNEPTPLSTLAPSSPKRLEWILEKALRKDRDERYQTTRELLSDLRAVRHEVGPSAQGIQYERIQSTDESATQSADVPNTVTETSKEAASTQPPIHTTSSAEYIATGIKEHKLATGIALTVFIAIVAAAGFALYKNALRPGSSAAVFQNVEITKVTTHGRAGDADISPDGKFIVYLEMSGDGNRSIMVRQIATGNTLAIVPPTKGNVLKKTSFSPDGNFVYYLFTDRTKPEALYRVAPIGGEPKKLIENCDSPAGPSPDGKQIAFVRWADRKSQLLVANADGTGEHVIAALQGEQFFAEDGLSWSPDGTTIACAAGTSQGDKEDFGLVGVDVNTGAIRPLSPKRWLSASRVVWMPDGHSLALIAVESEQEGRQQVWRVSYPAGEASRLTNDAQEHDESTLGVTADGRTLITAITQKLSRIEAIPASGDVSRVTRLSESEGNTEGFDGIAQAPDGRIVFASLEGNQADLWIMNGDGTNRKRLTSDSYWDGQPVVSPDGRYIVFTSNRTIGGMRLWRMDMDGNNLVQLTTQYSHRPDISPDGRWVVYNSEASNAGTTLGKVSIDGGDAVQLTNYLAQRPFYSPDGQSIACLVLDDTVGKNSWKYSVIPVNGAPPTRKFDFPGFQYQHINWTPDGHYISFIGTPPDPSNIWLQPAAGGEPHQVTNFKSDYIFRHVWSRDGRTLTLVRGRGTSDVVLIRDTK